MGGNFHIAPGKSFSLNHVHIHDVHPFSSSTFNVSHNINHLSFGEQIEFANTHPLDKMQVIAKDGKFLKSFFFFQFSIMLLIIFILLFFKF